MRAFMDKDFLLHTETAKHLYHDFAKKLPLFKGSLGRLKIVIVLFGLGLLLVPLLLQVSQRV